MKRCISRREPTIWARRGYVSVNGLCIAPTPTGSYATQGLMERLRERTPDEWWERAYEATVGSVAGVIGPCGDGVAFFLNECDDMGELFPDNVRDEIQVDAYEAAREVIQQGMSDHARRMVPVIQAIAQFARPEGGTDG